MQRGLTRIAAVGCLFLLAACAGTAKPATTAKGPLTSNAASASTARLATQMNSGDVTVYSLDDQQPQTFAAAPVTPGGTMHGVPSNRDDSVTVYPLDQAGLIGGPTNPDAMLPPVTGNYMPASPASAVERGTLQPMPGEASPLQEPMQSRGHLLTGQNAPLPPPGGFGAPGEPTAITADDTESSSFAAKMRRDRTTAAADEDNGGTVIGKPADGSPLRVYFRFNSFGLSPESDRVIQAAADAQGRGTTPMQVEGHASTKTATADPVKRSIINLKVSMNRAIAVTQRLIRDGVPATSIQTTAFGDTRPSLPVEGKSAEAASRRVEIYTGYAREPVATVATTE